MDTQGVTHAFRNHGPGNEPDRSQNPISPETVSVYLEVVENFDRVEKPRQISGGTITISYEKAINGKIVVVEEIRKRQKTLSFLSMWIKPRR